MTNGSEFLPPTYAKLRHPYILKKTFVPTIVNGHHLKCEICGHCIPVGQHMIVVDNVSVIHIHDDILICLALRQRWRKKLDNELGKGGP